MGLNKFFKSRFAEIIAGNIKHKIDGKKIGKNLDRELDKQLGQKSSERIKRDIITLFLFEVLIGLWDEDLKALIAQIKTWQHEIGQDKKDWQSRKSKK